MTACTSSANKTIYAPLTLDGDLVRLVGETRRLLPVLRDQLVEGAVEERAAELGVTFAPHRGPELLVQRPRLLDVAGPLELEA